MFALCLLVLLIGVHNKLGRVGLYYCALLLGMKVAYKTILVFALFYNIFIGFINWCVIKLLEDVLFSSGCVVWCLSGFLVFVVGSSEIEDALFCLRNAFINFKRWVNLCKLLRAFLVCFWFYKVVC